MNELIVEWEEYCKGASRYESSHFVGLLSQKWTDDELRLILRQLPFRDSVIQNLRRVYQDSQEEPSIYLRPKREYAGTPDELVSSIMSFIESQRRHLLKYEIDEDTAKWLRDSAVKVSFVSTDELRQVDPNIDERQYIRDEESEHRRYRPEARLTTSTTDSVEYRVLSGVREALYGLAADFYLAWFVLSPLFETGVDYGIYFDFWRMGGRYVLTDSRILVASIWSVAND